MNTTESENTTSRITEAVEEKIKEYALVPQEQRDMSISIYKQACLFEMLHLPKHYMFSHRIVLSDDKKNYKMVKRERPLEATDFVLEDRHDVGGKIPTFSERMGFEDSFKSHEHDELLWNALHCSVELKELQ